METQKKQIKQHLLENGNITSWEAITNYGITRLSAVIFKLKNDGLNIISVWEMNGKKRYTNYKLN